MTLSLYLVWFVIFEADAGINYGIFCMFDLNQNRFLTLHCCRLQQSEEKGEKLMHFDEAKHEKNSLIL